MNGKKIFEVISTLAEVAFVFSFVVFISFNGHGLTIAPPPSIESVFNFTFDEIVKNGQKLDRSSGRYEKRPFDISANRITFYQTLKGGKNVDISVESGPIEFCFDRKTGTYRMLGYTMPSHKRECSKTVKLKFDEITGVSVSTAGTMKEIDWVFAKYLSGAMSPQKAKEILSQQKATDFIPYIDKMLQEPKYCEKKDITSFKLKIIVGEDAYLVSGRIFMQRLYEVRERRRMRLKKDLSEERTMVITSTCKEPKDNLEKKWCEVVKPLIYGQSNSRFYDSIPSFDDCECMSGEGRLKCVKKYCSVLQEESYSEESVSSKGATVFPDKVLSSSSICHLKMAIKLNDPYICRSNEWGSGGIQSSTKECLRKLNLTEEMCRQTFPEKTKNIDCMVLVGVCDLMDGEYKSKCYKEFAAKRYIAVGYQKTLAMCKVKFKNDFDKACEYEATMMYSTEDPKGAYENLRNLESKVKANNNTKGVILKNYALEFFKEDRQEALKICKSIVISERRTACLAGIAKQMEEYRD